MIKFNKKYLSVFIEYSIAVFLCIIILIITLRLWNFSLNIPLEYSGDALSHGALTKGIIDNGWFLENKFFGMPLNGKFYDFPGSDLLHWIIMKFLSLFIHNFGGILNIYFFLTFIFVTLTTLYVFRQFKYSYPVSLVGTLLYTFIPYHFFRGISHLFLSAYYMIPLIVMVFIWIYNDELNILHIDESTKKYKFRFTKKFIFSFIICIFTASSGIYYAFFSCFFLSILFIVKLIQKKRLNSIVPISLIGIILLTIFINILPNLIYYHKYSKNNCVASRSPIETEIFSLRISRLFFPITDYGIKKISDAREIYRYSFNAASGEGDEYLSFAGIIGFFYLLFFLIKRNIANYDDKKLEILSFLNIIAVLFATYGGFNILFSLFINSSIRAYSRMSAFISFFSIFGFVILINNLSFKLNKINNRKRKIIFMSLLTIIFIVCIIDETNKKSSTSISKKYSFIPQYDKVKKEFNNHADFIKKIENNISKNAMIFQIPYISFPEGIASYNTTSYSQFIAYLHSKQLKWSFGAMRCRKSDLWQKDVVKLPVKQFVDSICIAGFLGIFIDRWGYIDFGDDLEKTIESILNNKPIVSNDGRYSFYNIEKYNFNLKKNFSTKKWDDIKNGILWSDTSGVKDNSNIDNDKPLDNKAFNADITIANIENVYKPEEKVDILIKIKNISSITWHANLIKNPINIGNHWLDKDGKILINDQARAGIPKNMEPNSETHIKLPVVMPKMIGDYILEIDLLQENITWFASKGSKTARMNIVVK